MKEQYERAIRRIREYNIRQAKDYTELAKKIDLLSLESIQYISGEHFSKTIKKIREVKIKRIPKKGDGIDNSLKLIRRILEEQVSSDYTDEGINNFIKLIENKEIKRKLKFYGVYIKQEIIGMAATTRDGNHIALLGISKEYQNQGIGRKLYKEVIKNATGKEIWVEVPPCSIPPCRKLGLIGRGVQEEKKGMQYLPMRGIITEK